MPEDSIPVSTEAKGLLEDHKRDGETWDDTLLRLALMDKSESSPVETIKPEDLPPDVRPDDS